LAAFTVWIAWVFGFLLSAAVFCSERT